MKTNQAELDRLKELKSYYILDTSSESDFDNIVKLIANICEVPIATVTLKDEDREWFKSSTGLENRENNRETDFCAKVILANSVFIVPDTLKDPNFSANPMVTGHPKIRFYAGVPLISPMGYALGVLAVKDYKPRQLTPLQIESLKTLADQVMVQLEIRRQNHILNDLSQQCEQINLKLTLKSELLEKEQRFLRALLDTMSEGIVACDDKGKLSFLNQAIMNFHGLHDKNIPLEYWPDYYSLYKSDTTTPIALDDFPLSRASRGEKVIGEELMIASKNISNKIVIVNGQPIVSSDGKRLGAVVAMLDITEQKAKQTELAKSEAKFSAIFNQSFFFQLLSYVDGTVIELNNVALRACGYQGADEIGKKLWETRWWNHDTQTSGYIQNLFLEGLHGETVCGASDYFVGSDKRRHIEFLLTPIPDENGKIIHVLLSGQDVTERKKSELEHARTNRALRLLSSSNELLIRNLTEYKLLTELCELIVTGGGYEMAWVGYSYDDPDKSINPIAHYGSFSHIENIKLSWSEHLEIGKGPAAITIRSGRAIVIEDIAEDSSFKPWADSAIRNGFRGVICLPLIHNQKVFGLIAMYTKEPVHPVSSEIKLLQELADNLAFGIMAIRTREDSQRLHDAFYKMAASVSASINDDFFLQLAKNMTEAIGADGGFVAQLINSVPLKARTIAAVVDGQKLASIEYDLMSSPCKYLLDSETFILSESLGECLQPSQTMISFGMQDYVGQQLLNSKGEVIGMLFIMLRKIKKYTDIALPLLKVFAARAGAELDRMESVRHIHEQASLLDKAQDAIIVCGLDNKIQFWNNGAERLYGWTREEAIDASIRDLLFPEDATEFNIAMHKLLIHGEWKGEVVQCSKFSKKLIIDSHWTLVYDDQGNPQSVFAINTNITEQKAAAEKIQHLAFYDPLTHLPNRTLLLDRLKQALISCERYHHFSALLFIDLDNFKGLNDTLGHDIGDLFLIEIANRITTCVRETDCIARFGGDEFVVMLEAVSTAETEAAILTTKVVEKILQCLSAPYILGKYEHQSTASIGVTLFSNAVDNMNDLLKHADLAMYQAKSLGRNTFRFFDPKMQLEISTRVSLEADLRQSLSKCQLSLHYQPQFNDNGFVVGAEALLRWLHPERGMVSPELFIPIAEETRMILQIGLWVLETACEKIAKWSMSKQTSQLVLAVNVSERQFRQPDFVEQVFGAIDYFGANPKRLKLELTESLFAENVEDIINKMHKLKERGISFSLDDFGTGYSSLSYLKQMPLDQLKIDQSFVRDVLLDPNDASIAITIISLAKSLDLEVIAEGVETEAQRNFLKESGCNLYQGYLFSKPLAHDEFDVFLKKQNKKIT